MVISLRIELTNSVVRFSTVFQQGRYLGSVQHEACGRNQQIRCENVMLLSRANLIPHSDTTEY